MKYSCVFIGVNYQTSSETIKWVESINALDDKDEILIVVVDNSSEQLDTSLESTLASLNDRLVYINTGGNLGYLPGASKGIEYLNEQGIGASFVVVCNVDIRFESKNMVKILKSQDTNGVGLFSPRIISSRGGDLNPYRINRLSKKQIKNRILYFKYPQFRKLVDKLRGLRKKHKKSSDSVYQKGTKMFMTYGACFIFCDNYFRMGGDINTPLPLYMEEPYVGETCSRLHLDTVYLPEITIKDIGHVSTGKLSSKESDRILLEVTNLLYKMYYLNS